MLQTDVGEKTRTHILCSVTFSNCVICEIMRKHVVEPDRPEKTMHMPFMLDN